MYFYKIQANGTHNLISIVPNSFINESIDYVVQSNNRKILVLDNSYQTNNTLGAAIILKINSNVLDPQKKNIAFYYDNSKVYGGDIVNNELTHFVTTIGTIDSSSANVKIYQDGNLLSLTTTDFMVPIQNLNYDLRIGKSLINNNESFDGLTKYFRIYDYELTQSDVSQLYISRNIPNAQFNNNGNNTIITMSSTNTVSS